MVAGWHATCTIGAIMEPMSHIPEGASETSLHGRRTVGKVASLFPERGYGVIETPDGMSVLFGVHEVIAGNFFELEPGDPVHTEFSAQGAKQPVHATSVQPLGKHHLTE